MRTGVSGATSMSEDVNQSAAPVLIVPYVWIGDFVRCHSVVKLLRTQKPDRPVDIVSSTLCAPLADYMPGVRRAIVIDLPRRRLGIALQRQLAESAAQGKYGQALVMSRKWKAALAPWLAGIPMRTGFAGEFRFGLLNDVRFGERKLPRMIDQMGALALPKGAPPPTEWPLPELKVPAHEVDAWRVATRARGRNSAYRYAVAGRGWRRQGMAGPLTMPNWRGRSRETEHRSGYWAGRTNRCWRNKSWRPPVTACAISRAEICATQFLRWPQLILP